VLYFIFLSVLTVITVIVSDKLVIEKLMGQSMPKKRLFILLIITIAFLQHIYFELHLGNINIFLLMLSLLALYLLIGKKDWMAGFILALAVLIKPHFLILLPLLLLRKRFVTVIACFAAVLFGLLIPSLYKGFDTNLALLNEWKKAMLLHNVSPVLGQDTVYSWLYRLTGSSITEAYQPVFVLSVLGLVALLFLTLFFYHKRKEALTPDADELVVKNIIFEYLVLVALIPNLTVTDSEHFLFSVPLIAWIINYLFIRKPGYLLTAIIVIVLFLYGGNLREAIGAPASRWMTAKGILGLGNILLIGMSIYLMIKSPGNLEKLSPSKA
jgi:hypothetical protein